jgi:hypothetical protein
LIPYRRAIRLPAFAGSICPNLIPDNPKILVTFVIQEPQLIAQTEVQSEKHARNPRDDE